MIFLIVKDMLMNIKSKYNLNIYFKSPPPKKKWILNNVIVKFEFIPERVQFRQDTRFRA